MSASSRAARLMDSSEQAVGFFVGGIGDAILALPAVRAAAHRFGGGMRMLCTRPADSIFATIPGLDIVRVRVTGDGAEYACVDAKLEARLLAPDLFISFVDWGSPALTRLIRAIGPKLSVGMFEGCDVPVAKDPRQHAAQRAFDIPRAIWPELSIHDHVSPITFPAETRAGVEPLFAGLPEGARVLIVHADTHPDKMWPADRFAHVLDLFLHLHPDWIVLVVGQDEQPLNTGIHADRVVPCHGLVLAESLHLLERADLFLGVDSCVLHAADLARVPSVGLFGVSRADLWGFVTGPNISLQASGSMKAITVRRVLWALESMLARPEQSAIVHVRPGPHAGTTHGPRREVASPAATL